jgi:hypothetical protein
MFLASGGFECAQLLLTVATSFGQALAAVAAKRCNQGSKGMLQMGELASHNTINSLTTPSRSPAASAALGLRLQR